ncbi:VgrG-related protein [Plantactinospora endophytica]|uniref:Type IV secretion protein Rhs n=1 Tax=Plantactinospora endophytica TaxID=673535 RepID=A0ABQ4E8K1_9ACTN|nr:VgrG-related protein [Plantactinospora endophytica]GIG90617.1 type IV secretion protein Rhs [Plantactinospora endophytica]
MSEGNLTNLLKVGLPMNELPDPWPDELVYGSVDDGAGMPAVATLRYRDPGSLLLEKARIEIGRKVTVAVRAGDGKGETALFTGEVVTVETEFDGTGTYTTIRAMDLSHRLMRGRRVARYLNQKASDVAGDLARSAGLPIGRIDPTTVVYEMVSQPNVSDWEFLTMLAADNDAEVAVVDGRFEFRRPVRAASAPGPQTTAERSDFVAEVDGNVLTMRAAVTSVGQFTDVEVRGWDRRTREPVIGRAPVQDSDEVGIPVTAGEVAARFGTAEMLVADVPYETLAEVGTVSRAVAAQVAAGVAEIEVAVRGNPRLRAGVPFALTGVGEPFAGKYTVTTSRHVFGPARFYQTWLTVSSGRDRSLAGLTAGDRAPARSARMPGLAIGVVTDVNAALDRNHPERRDRGWVRLRFPWLDDKYETDWVRTVQLGGFGGGGVYCPEVGDEVLVGFEQGLLDRPYVVGGLYNGLDQPSPHDMPLVDPTSGAVNRLSFASRQGRAAGRRSTGNWVELLDGPTVAAPQGVRLRTRSGTDNLLLHLDRAGTSVVVRSDGSVVIEAKTEVTVQGTQGVSVESGGPVSVKGRGVSVDAGAGELKLTGASVSVAGRVVRIN